MASDVTRYALVPVEATAENGLKRALIGEFEEPFTRMGEDGNEVTHYVSISWTSIKCIYRKAVAASPGQGAVTAEQLEAAAEAAYAEMSYAAVLYDGGEEMPDWTEADADSKALMRRIAKAAFTCPALGLQVQP